jgi:hypothetical protein
MCRITPCDQRPNTPVITHPFDWDLCFLFLLIYVFGENGASKIEFFQSHARSRRIWEKQKFCVCVVKAQFTTHSTPNREEIIKFCDNF